MYKEYLTKIEKLTRKYGDSLQPPASFDQVQKLINRAKSDLGLLIPIDYTHLLQLHNGLDWNGLSIYATETIPIEGYTDRFISGCVDANLLRRDFPKWKDFLIFGETGDEDYCLNLISSSYEVVDSVSVSTLEVFSSFDELIAQALRAHI